MFGSKEASEDKLKKMVKRKMGQIKKTVSGFGQDNAGSACKSLLQLREMMVLLIF